MPRLFALNDFPGLVELPEIIPSGIQMPSASEVALMLRAMGLDISKDKTLLDHLWHIMGFPSMSDTTFEEVYAKQSENKNNAEQTEFEEQDDSAEKLFEQNDQRYV